MRTSKLLVLVLGLAAVALTVRGGCHRFSGGTAETGGGHQEQPQHVLIVTIDTLRADAVGSYGATPARTPAFDRLAAGGVRFDRAFAPAPITLTSHATLLTGLDPPSHGGRHNGVAIRTDVPTLAEAFASAGFATAAFVSAFPLDRRFGLSRGFDVYSDRMPRGPDGRPANERPGRATVDEAIAWLQSVPGKRVFLWVHLFEPHAPYGDASTGRSVAERYGEEVAEADRQLGRLLDALGARRSATLTVVAADHGEAFGEHGEIGHSIFIYDTTLRVPLVIAGLGVPTAAVVAEPAGLVDVAATIRQAAGLPAADSDGADLSGSWNEPDWRRPGDLYAESFAPLLDFGWSSLRSVRTAEWKYIDAPAPELFRISTDPFEARNLAHAERATARDLAERVARISGPELTKAASPIDPDAARRLRALGYASGAPAGSGPGRPRRDPKDGQALAARLASIASGELTGDRLAAALEEVLREDPRNPQANVRLGYVRLNQRRCADAEALFARAIREGLPGADAHLGLATCQGVRGALVDARRALERADAREPGNPVVLANLGVADAATGQDEAAIEHLRAALALDPDLHEARFHLARALARAGRREEAARQARELLARLPASAPQRSEVERLLRSVS
jgi:arylsulfatase A-like enzyme/Flp pilus assembly protein TadD